MLKLYQLHFYYPFSSPLYLLFRNTFFFFLFGFPLKLQFFSVMIISIWEFESPRWSMAIQDEKLLMVEEKNIVPKILLIWLPTVTIRTLSHFLDE